MPNPSPQPLPPPIASPSKKRLLANQTPKRAPYENSVSDHSHFKDRITRNLPNLSECHGCARRIDYSNPKSRLQPLDSFWRVVLLCKVCIKRVNSGRACVYCFKYIENSSSDCFSCRDCERLVHKDCVTKYGNSAPWSYCCKGFGLGLRLSVCIDCWVPELLKSSIRVCRNENGVGSKAHSGEKCLEDMVKDANCTLEKKIEVAAKAKEKTLRKAVVAKNAGALAGSALHLAVKKDGSGATSEGSGRNSNDLCSGAKDVTRVVDDAELAFRLHRTMNSSPRISRNLCSLNLSRLDLLKKIGSSSISTKWMNFGSCEGDTVGRNPKLDDHEESILEASANEGDKECGSPFVPHRLNSVIKTYKRHNLKRKDFSVNDEANNDGTCMINDDRSMVLEKPLSQDVSDKELCVKNAQPSCPEKCNGNDIPQEESALAKSDRYSLKYCKKKKCSRRILNEEASSCYVASKKVKDLILGLPAYSLTEWSRSSDASSASCVVNLPGCASVGVSSEESCIILANRDSSAPEWDDA